MRGHTVLRRTWWIPVMALAVGCITSFDRAQRLVREAEAIIPCGDLEEAKAKAEKANQEYAKTGDPVLREIKDIEDVRREIESLLEEADKSLADSKNAPDKDKCLTCLNEAEISIEKARSRIHGYEGCASAWEYKKKLTDLRKRLQEAHAYLTIHNPDPLFEEAQKLVEEAKAALPCGDLKEARTKAKTANQKYAHTGDPVLNRIKEIEDLRKDVGNSLDEADESLANALASEYQEDCFPLLEEAEADLEKARSETIKECENVWGKETAASRELGKRLADARDWAAKLPKRPRGSLYVLQIDKVTRDDVERIRKALTETEGVVEVRRTQHEGTGALIEFKSTLRIEEIKQSVRKIDAVPLEITKVSDKKIYAQPRTGIY